MEELLRLRDELNRQRVPSDADVHHIVFKLLNHVIAAATVPPLHVKHVRYGAKTPVRMSKHAAGLDLFACLDTAYQIILIEPGRRAVVSTGIAVKIPEGYEGQCRPRSGLAKNHGITVLNTPGTIDEDYVGELGVTLINHGLDPFQIKHGDRIAQLVITPTIYVPVEVVEELPETGRGSGGFGSTGV
jgi:dUTP pyrophosphatase